MKQTFKFLTLSRVFNDCRSTLGRLSTLLLLLFALSFGFNQEVKADQSFNQVWGTYNTGGSDDGADLTSDKNLGTVSKFQLKDVYIKCHDNWGAGRTAWNGGAFYYSTDNGANWTEKVNTSTDWKPDNWVEADYQFKILGFNHTFAENNSGNYKILFKGKVWGTQGDTYRPSKEGHNTWTFTIAPPAIKTGTYKVSVTGDDVKGGTGTESDPYIVVYNGSVTFSISGTQDHSDANSNLQLVVWDGTKDHTAPSTNRTSLTLSNITCAKTGMWVKGMYRNSSDATLNGATTQEQVWIQAEPSYSISVASNNTDMGTASPASVTAYQYYQASNTVTASNKTGYHFVDWTATSGVTINSASATSTTLKASTTGTVTANFAVNNYSITYNPLATAENKHFTYTTAPDNADYNSTVGMTFTPDANYVIAEVTAYKTGDESTSVSVTRDGETNNYSFIQPAYDVTVKVVVSLSQVNVIYGVNGSNGTLTAYPEPTTGKVDGGTNITFTADPADYYHLVGWYSDVNCTQVISDANASSLTYTISNISEDASVYVKFAENWTLNGTFNGSPINTPFGNWNDGVGYVDINNLNTSDTHTFTINFKDETHNITYGRSTAITPASCSELDFTSGAGACTLTPSITGNYRILVNAETKKVTVTYPTMPVPGSITVTKERYLGDTKKESFIATDPVYQVYTDEKIVLTIEEVAAPTGCTTYYQFGENAASSTVRTYVIENPTTVENQSIEAKVFYRSLSGSADGAPQTETIYYQGVSLPALHLSASWNEKEESELSENPQVIIYYSAENYAGAATVTSSVDGATPTDFMTITTEIQKEADYQMANKQPHRYDFAASATVNGRDFAAATSVSIYRLVKVTVSDPNRLMNHYYAWIQGTDPIQYEQAWPGKEFEGKLGDAHIFFVKYPSYTHFVLNDGKAENATQTVDVPLPTQSTCYTIGAQDLETKKYAVNEADPCPDILYVGNIENVTLHQGESQLIAPDVDLDYGYSESQLTITFPNLPSNFTAVQQGKKFLLTGNTQCAATSIKAVYTLSDGVNTHSEERTFQASVTHPSHVLIQVSVNTSYGWNAKDQIYIKYFNHNVSGETNMAWHHYHNNQDYYSARIPLGSDGKVDFMVHAWQIEDDHKDHQTTDMNNVDADGCYYVASDIYDGKRGIARSGGDCWAEYQVKIDMASGVSYTSNAIENMNDVVSFYAPGKNETGTKSGLVRIMRNGTQVATVDGNLFNKSGVYTAKIVDNGGTISLDEVALYTGDYYIRTDGVNPDNTTDAWDITKHVKERTMTNFSLYDGAKYNYYWTKNVKKTSLNVKARVANKYNDNLAVMLVESSYTDNEGNILGTIDSGTGVNLRFGYNPETNYLERAILRGSTASANYFLNVQGDNVFNDAACETQELNETNYGSHPAYSVFNDVSDWVYEKLIFVKIDGSHPSASILLKSKDFNNKVMYQLGYTTDYLGHTTEIPAQRVVMGQGTSQGKYALRVIYDYKTNRLSATWEPSGEINEVKKVDSDILFVSNEGGEVKQITFGNDSTTARLESLQSVMYVLELENNDGDKTKTPDAQYWIALPFECKISDIFGIENYITLDENRIAQSGYWGIMRYRGDLRAQKGWFIEDTPDGFWEWMYPTETLMPGEGYVLYVEKSSLSWNSITVEEPCEGTEDGCQDGKKSVQKYVKRFYFPSLVEGFTMNKSTDASSKVTYPNQPCNITSPVNRRAEDSNWKVIAPKSYNNVTINSAEDQDQEHILGPNFIYEYNEHAEKGSRYTPKATKDFEFKAFHGYMAQYGGTITWNPYSKTEHPTSAPRFAEEPSFKGGMLTIELVQNNEQLDRTFVKLSKNGTEGFDQNLDLTKITESCSQIASVSEDVLYAGNTLPLDIEMVPLNVKVVADGTYDIALAQSLEGLEVRLYDAFEQTTTPLDMMSATITLDKGEYKDRFFLQLKQKGSDTPTSFDGKLEQYNLPTDKTQKLLINDNIYLINAGRIYNVLGVRP